MTRVPSDSSDSYASQRPSGEKGASPSIEASSSSTWRSLNVRTRRGHHRTQERDLPRKTPSSTEALLRRAHFAGTNVGSLCEHIYRTEGPPGVRRVLGVLSLVKKHGAAVVDDVAQIALEAGAPSYRFVKNYLERRPPLPLSLRQVDPLIRQLTLYRDLIDQRTGDQT